MENQLNFEVVSDEELMTINGGQNMLMTDGGCTLMGNLGLV
ncbi:lactococcin family bacteriocin [Lactococcus lactis]|nr:lactococcin family bacteriocin [Lactococcus lactis]MDM7519897.1 lactococcin family bacteriocin [Lactococcus lactis]MDM7535520.1 lactococcin family bacteriocin [Lactococcus lactis]